MDLYRALYDSQDDGKLYAECVLTWLDCKYPHLTHQAGRFLDLGCGNGNFLKAFHQQASEWELYGIDQRVSIIEEARSNCPTGNFNVGTFPPLPYEDNFFNLVFSKNIFDYADTRPKESKIGSSIFPVTFEVKDLSGEIQRILKVGGIWYPFESINDNEKEIIGMAGLIEGDDNIPVFQRV